MRSIIHETFGDPATVLKPGESPDPVAGKGEVLVRTILSPIHNHDLWTVRGSYGYKPELPAIGGSEAVGIVESVGDGVDAGLVGKRVAAAGIRGSWAEKFTVPVGAAVPLPDAISDELGAQLIAMPFSAISLLEFLEVEKGDRVIQTAANGAVGKILAVLAKSRGIETLNLVRRDEAVGELEALGMENVISTASDGWKERAKAILGENGARAAVDSVGGAIASDLADLLGNDGLLVTFGTATGAPLELNSGTLIFKHLTVKGFWGARVSAEMAPQDRARLVGELVGLAASGKLDLATGGIYGFDDAAAAMKAAQTPGRKGKILLRP
ncbi:zinc-binding dehydrogenase [Oricola thermophila]|uniref:Zinc-binding dehydrogenase n=1 Tax=Oricola thermophila TaxID=2742145 RepID=A0A6N1VG62_9HYPH|nr:zinc-binding dehydrogenase [Oricola thermophila]QKV19910.1 zinc-binding dehydrogenase [Oricola thermophila]